MNIRILMIILPVLFGIIAYFLFEGSIGATLIGLGWGLLFYSLIPKKYKKKDKNVNKDKNNKDGKSDKNSKKKSKKNKRK